LVVRVEVDKENLTTARIFPSGWEGSGGVAGSIDQRSFRGEDSVLGASRSTVQVEVGAILGIEVTSVTIVVIWPFAAWITSSGNSNYITTGGVVEVVDGCRDINCVSIIREDIDIVKISNGGPGIDAVVVERVEIGGTGSDGV